MENPQKLWQRPGRNEAILQRHTVSQYDCQTIETVDPTEMGMSPRISCWQKERTPARGELVSQRDFSQFRRTHQMRALTVMGQ